jgi:hypothetical protein
MTAFDSLWTELENEVGPLLSDELSQQAPVGDPDTDLDSGTLSQSMKWEDQDGVLTIGSQDPRGPIAAYVTRGTQPHEIVPVFANALHFFVGGDEVFTQHVDHPGTTANPFHIAGWEARRDEVQQMFMERMGHGVTMTYLNPWRNRTLGE